jgi:tetratricopeptide (TPR) repeat protein/SAM-dependent methyltransferase
MLGIIAARVGNLEAAAELYGRALTTNRRNAECHFNIAQVLRAQGRNQDAIAHLKEATAIKHDYVAAYASLADLLFSHNDLEGARACYEQALALDPRLVDARHGLANTLRLLGRLNESAQQFQQVVTIRPDYAEAFSNLGVVLAAQGHLAEAAKQYHQAIAIKPSLVDVYRNLARVLLADGRPDEALAASMRGLAIGETNEARAVFVQCAQAVEAIPQEPFFHDLVVRALMEGWGRAGDLSPMAATVFIEGASDRAAMAPFLSAEPHAISERMALLAGMSENRLLRALLEAAPVRNSIVEYFLTTVRSTLLDLANDTATTADPRILILACALAQQCFINEYVFATTEAQSKPLVALNRKIDSAINSGAPIPPLWLAVLGAFVPLHTLPRASALIERHWPEPLAAVLNQQVREPAIERDLAAAIPALTAIDDDVSIKVRSQYEEMPYPRWVKTPSLGQPIGIDWYLRSQFPTVPIRPVQRAERLDVLIAGCGTGQHAIETATRFAGAHVLAIDLSWASLSYAARKTRETKLRNIEYAQADILNLGALNANFDVIESSGVLHHMHDPLLGWRVLLSLLRPGGVMHIGLYSAAARADIRSVRAFISDRNYQQTAADIRHCRQELLSFEVGTPLKNVTQYADFFSTCECRDLLFHAQEWQFTIPEIKTFLTENRLNFLGFSGPVTQVYRSRFPDDQTMTDLDRWTLIESENPLAFVNMYQFWVQKII